MCAPAPEITVCLFSQTYQCIRMRKHLSITLFATITPPSHYQKHNISCMFQFLNAHTCIDPSTSVLALYVCVFHIIFTTAIAYVSRILPVSRGLRSIILCFRANLSHSTVMTSQLLYCGCSIAVYIEIAFDFRHQMKSNLLLSSETCNQITTKLHDK